MGLCASPCFPWPPHSLSARRKCTEGQEEQLDLSPRPWLTPDRLFLLPVPHPQGQHYEEEKRALSHEIVALNSHLLEAKVTIDKLSEDNVSVGPF